MTLQEWESGFEVAAYGRRLKPVCAAKMWPWFKAQKLTFGYL